MKELFITINGEKLFVNGIEISNTAQLTLSVEPKTTGNVIDYELIFRDVHNLDNIDSAYIDFKFDYYFVEASASIFFKDGSHLRLKDKFFDSNSIDPINYSNYEEEFEEFDEIKKAWFLGVHIVRTVSSCTVEL